MSNPIKYSTTSEPLSLNKGNFYFGTGDVGKGPSDSTGYYNGFPPSVGGYIIYLYKDGSPGSLSYHNAPTDNDLISFTNSLSGTSYTTVEECLSYFSSQDNMVVFNKNYESIVTDGLVLNLDAGFVSSYPRTGTTWKDLSGNGNNGTLVNGVGFSGGSIVFDGSNDYVEFGNILNQGLNSFTITTWFVRKNNTSGWLLSKSYAGAAVGRYWLDIDNTKIRVGIAWTAGHTDYFSNSSIQNDLIYNVVAVINRIGNLQIYLNGLLDAEYNISDFSTVQLNTSYPFRIGSYTASNQITPFYFFNGNIYQTSIYNRALSSEEVLQNYYAGLQRFIPTDGLVLSLDAQNTNTTTNITYDTSGNNNNGTLLNGVQYVSDGNGSWSFDGVDDYISFPQGTFDLTNRSFSLEAIVKWDGNATGTFFSHFSTPVGTQTSIHWRIYTTGMLRFDFYASAIDIPSAISPNTWYHLVITYNYSSDVCTAYINGAMRLSNNAGPYIGSTNLSNTSIGKWMNTEYFGGKVSHFMMYDRILNSEEVTIMYNSVKSTYTI